MFLGVFLQPLKFSLEKSEVIFGPESNKSGVNVV